MACGSGSGLGSVRRHQPGRGLRGKDQSRPSLRLELSSPVSRVHGVRIIGVRPQVTALSRSNPGRTRKRAAMPRRPFRSRPLCAWAVLSVARPLRPPRRAALLRPGRAVAAAMTGRVCGVPGFVPADDVFFDVASGTAGITLQLVARGGAQVVGVDLTGPMLRQGQRRVTTPASGAGSRWWPGAPSSLPLPDASFDALTFTYLLRYARVAGHAGRAGSRTQAGRDDGQPGVLRAGSDHSGVRPGRVTRTVLPRRSTAQRPQVVSGESLPRPDVSAHYRRYPVTWTVAAWEKAGLTASGPG